jgi:hypothetical protein
MYRGCSTHDRPPKAQRLAASYCGVGYIYDRDSHVIAVLKTIRPDKTSWVELGALGPVVLDAVRVSLAAAAAD